MVKKTIDEVIWAIKECRTDWRHAGSVSEHIDMAKYLLKLLREGNNNGKKVCRDR